jgi:tRNA modification GTPase
MHYSLDESTICALSTASGSAAIALIRVSGKEAISITQRFFSKKLEQQLSHTLHFGTWKHQDELIDEVLLSVFRAPKSYTGENMVEISCHGSVYIQQKILQQLTESGCRMAMPGEFSFRAFLNGKLDLSQAEAVSDLINSQTRAAHDIAIKQMRGGISGELKELRQQLIDFAALIELELDFSEEDVEFASRKHLQALIEKLLVRIQQMAESFLLGNSIKNGIPVVIAGKPNVGKSTLLNALLNEEKAIVSDIAGTTRDSIEDVIQINGIAYRFIDTAGIRRTDDVVEGLGIQRSIDKIKQAQLVMFLVEATVKDNIEEELQTLMANLETMPEKAMVVINKADLVDDTTFFKSDYKGFRTLLISARNKSNLEELKRLIVDSTAGTLDQNQLVISNIRHYEALRQASLALKNALNNLQAGQTGELLAFDIRDSLHHLGLITGEVSTNDLLDSIFTRFCIGK